MLQDPNRERSVVPPGLPLPPERRRFPWGWTLAVSALALIVVLGPRPRVEGRWVEPEIGGEIDAWLAGEEAGVPRLRPGEAKSVLWVDSAMRGRTPLALVYLHGYSADRHEIDPLVGDLARQLGANAYFARLSGHGQDGNALADATADDWLADAAEAVAVGTRIGERVLLIGASTGATLALWAASRPEAADRLAALVLISPNLGLRDARSQVLLWPWGGLIARALEGGERCFRPLNAAQERHWTTCYPTRALLPMMAVVDHVRSLDLSGVRVPTMVFYSQRDEVVDPAATDRLLSGLGPRVRFREVNDSGDPAHHILAGATLSPGTTDRVREEIRSFLQADVR